MRGKPSATNEEDLFGGSSSSQIHLVLHLGLRSRVVFSTAQSFGPVLPVFSLVKGKPWFLQRMNHSGANYAIQTISKPWFLIF